MLDFLLDFFLLDLPCIVLLGVCLDLLARLRVPRQQLVKQHLRLVSVAVLDILCYPIPFGSIVKIGQVAVDELDVGLVVELDLQHLLLFLRQLQLQIVLGRGEPVARLLLLVLLQSAEGRTEVDSF